MALAWKAGWVQALAGSNPASSAGWKMGSDLRKRRSIRSAPNTVASDIKAASLSSGLSFGPPICAKHGPPRSRAVRRHSPAFADVRLG